MLKYLRSRSKIQRRIFYSFLIVLIMPTTFISISSYLISIKLLEEKVSDAFLQNLNYIGSNVERHLNEWEDMTEYIYANHTIRNVMQKDYTSDVEFFHDMVEADAVIQDYALGSNIYSDISSLAIIGMNGKSLLYGGDVSRLDIEKTREMTWFQDALKLNGKINWSGMERKDPARDYDPYVISLSRAMNVEDQNIAVIYIAFNEKYLRKILQDVTQGSQNNLQIIDNNQRLVFNEGEKEELFSYVDTGELEKLRKQGEGYFVTENNGEKTLVAHHYIEAYDWWVTESISHRELIKDNNQIFYTTAIAFAISFIISGILWLIISRSIVRPIKDLSETMRSIRATSDILAIKTDISSYDEIGMLNESFQHMLKQINTLFEDVLDEQSKKKDAEYRALQAQINPHFLYNTLNTIRWMAIIQKSDNIKEMVEVLGRLIRSTFRNDGSLITIHEELALSKDYLYIQQIRYKDKFKMIYDLDEEILDSLCVKFIMQPILENAIFHGIEPKEGQATVYVGIKKVATSVRITIEDNGIGMTKDQITNIFNRSNESGIGIRSIDERIKYMYGTKEGITIESELHKYTRVMIQFPYLKKRDQDV